MQLCMGTAGRAQGSQCGDNPPIKQLQQPAYVSCTAKAFFPCCRIHALFFTDRICCEPLTEWVHFADLREGQPGYMLYLVRIVHAFAELCSNLSLAMGPYADAGSVSGLVREQQLTDGIPYMLRDPRQATTPVLVTRSAS